MYDFVEDVMDMTSTELIEEIVEADMGYSWDDLEDEDTDDLRNLVRRIRRESFDEDEDDEDEDDFDWA